MLGELQEASRNAQKRAEERIEVNPASMKHLGLESREAVLVVDGVEGRCLLRDLSFSGAKVLVHGKAEAFLEKPVLLRPDFSDRRAPVTLAGRVLRWEGMANREDIGAIAIRFEEGVPIQYKLAINACLRHGRAPAARASGVPGLRRAPRRIREMSRRDSGLRASRTTPWPASPTWRSTGSQARQIGSFQLDSGRAAAHRAAAGAAGPRPEDISWQAIIAAMLKVLAYRPEAAEADYYRRFILAAQPDIKEEFTRAGILKAERGELDLALEIFRSMAGLFPDCGQTRNNLALVYEQQADRPGSRRGGGSGREGCASRPSRPTRPPWPRSRSWPPAT